MAVDGEARAGGVAESPAAERNKEPILAVLRRVLPPRGTVLEIASGTGQHALHFAAALPALDWQPTEPDPELLLTIRQRLEARTFANVRLPLALDVLVEPWPVADAAAVLCINMIHIAPWAAAEALFGGARRLLPGGAPLVLYGPFRRHDAHTAPSNAAFDASLRARNPQWGVRDLEAVAALGADRGFALAETVAMPANNLTVIFTRVAQ